MRAAAAVALALAVLLAAWLLADRPRPPDRDPYPEYVFQRPASTPADGGD